MTRTGEKTMAPEQIAAAIATPGTYAVHASASALDAAIALCRGSYQVGIVRGRESLSGSTLTGKAASYGGHYARSRASLLSRLASAGLATEVRGPKGRRVLVIGA